jgi:hypothetical protein
MRQLGLNEGGPPQLVEYLAGSEPWRCNRFDLLQAEFEILTPGQSRPGLMAERLALFHQVASATSRSWTIVRRLFGLVPVIPAATVPGEDLRTWEREELRQALGLTRPQLKQELDAVRGAWQAQKPKDESGGEPEKELREEFRFEDEETLREHGLDMKFESGSERAWFARRVKDYEKILREPFAAVLGRNALMSELRMRQVDNLLNESSSRGVEWKGLLKVRQDLDSGYQDLLKQLRELCPWAGAIAGKHSFQGVVSEITAAMQEYHAHGDHALIDGIFTRTEILVECRRSTQVPEPRYRAGLVVYLNAAKANLWNPHWSAPFKAGDLKKLDAAWKAAYAAVATEAGEALPDLEENAGEYAKIEENQTSNIQPPTSS